MKGLIYWKVVGGYLTLVKVNNRWHYLADDFTAFFRYVEDHGWKPIRVNKCSAAARLWGKNGRTMAALKNNLPHISRGWMEAR